MRGTERPGSGAAHVVSRSPGALISYGAKRKGADAQVSVSPALRSGQDGARRPWGLCRGE